MDPDDAADQRRADAGGNAGGGRRRFDFRREQSRRPTSLQFMDGMHTALVVGALVEFVGCLIALATIGSDALGDVAGPPAQEGLCLNTTHCETIA